MQAKSFGQWLQKQMSRRNATAEDMRLATGITTGQLKLYLSNAHLPNLKAAGRIAIALGIKPNELWRGIKLALNSQPKASLIEKRKKS